MKQKTIPLEGYTDGVRKIITRSVADQQKIVINAVGGK